MSDLRRINRDLKRHFGNAQGDALGRARFRVAWSQQTEKRIGNVIKETESGIYLGVQSGVHELPKYNFNKLWDEPHWLIEQLLFAPLPEVPDTEKGSYECFYVLPYIDGHAVLPPYRALQLLLHSVLYGAKKTIDDYVKEDEKNFKKEVASFLEILEDQRSYMQGQLQDGDAITMAPEYKGESPLLRELAARKEENRKDSLREAVKTLKESNAAK
jgi:hypothetical protein